MNMYVFQRGMITWISPTHCWGTADDEEVNLSPRLASSGCLVLLVASALLPQILQPLTSRIPIDSAGTQSGISVLQSLPFLLNLSLKFLYPCSDSGCGTLLWGSCLETYVLKKLWWCQDLCNSFSGSLRIFPFFCRFSDDSLHLFLMIKQVCIKI